MGNCQVDPNFSTVRKFSRNWKKKVEKWFFCPASPFPLFLWVNYDQSTWPSENHSTGSKIMGNCQVDPNFSKLWKFLRKNKKKYKTEFFAQPVLLPLVNNDLSTWPSENCSTGSKVMGNCQVDPNFCTLWKFLRKMKKKCKYEFFAQPVLFLLW